MIQVGSFPFQSHSLRTCVEGHIFCACIVEAERNKHCRPIAVGIAVPLAVAGYAATHAICINLEIQSTFGITKLRPGYQNCVLPGGRATDHIG